MVYLNRIYTKSGDKGETSLGDGSRLPKTHPRIVAYGGVDELNSVLGVAVSAGLPAEIADRIRGVQNDLFDIGADLCLPDKAKTSQPPLRVAAAQVETLERWIDEANERLQPLESFVLPGGTAAAALLHHARTVCRRVEVAVVRVAESETINPNVLAYVNRLSDLLFVLARVCNNDGQDDVLWQPGRGQATEQ